MAYWADTASGKETEAESESGKLTTTTLTLSGAPASSAAVTSSSQIGCGSMAAAIVEVRVSGSTIPHKPSLHSINQLGRGIVREKVSISSLSP
jgi:hypothetical protein